MTNRQAPGRSGLRTPGRKCRQRLRADVTRACTRRGGRAGSAGKKQPYVIHGPGLLSATGLYEVTPRDQTRKVDRSRVRDEPPRMVGSARPARSWRSNPAGPRPACRCPTLWRGSPTVRLARSRSSCAGRVPALPYIAQAGIILGVNKCSLGGLRDVLRRPDRVSVAHSPCRRNRLMSNPTMTS